MCCVFACVCVYVINYHPNLHLQKWSTHVATKHWSDNQDIPLHLQKWEHTHFATKHWSDNQDIPLHLQKWSTHMLPPSTGLITKTFPYTYRSGAHTLPPSTGLITKTFPYTYRSGAHTLPPSTGLITKTFPRTYWLPYQHIRRDQCTNFLHRHLILSIVPSSPPISCHTPFTTYIPAAYL